MPNQKWSLYLWKPHKNYPSEIYVWIDPDDKVAYSREVLPLGFRPTFNVDALVGYTLDEFKKMPGFINGDTNILNTRITKIKADNTKETQEYLSRGILIR
jgi:hypothetical protein